MEAVLRSNASVGRRQCGAGALEKGMSLFCRPFTTAKIRYFDRRAIEEARTWLEGN